MSVEFRKDKAGFPMFWVEEAKLYIHWLPITKIQFEFFMCDAPDNRFDATWYDEVLQLNGRISPGSIRLNNYWHAFLTGVTPAETQAFARWSGEGYQLPTLAKWNEIYKSLQKKPPIKDPLDRMGSLGLNQRTTTILQKLENVSNLAPAEYGYDRSLADQIFMRLGVMEWVESDILQHRWGGMGETYSSFHSSLFTPNNGQPQAPKEPEVQRLSYYGARLLWSDR